MPNVLCRKILYQNNLNRMVIIEKLDNNLIKITLQTPMKGGPSPMKGSPYSQKIIYIPYSGNKDVKVFL